MAINPKAFVDPSDIAGVLAARDASADGITAFASGGRANATLLLAARNRVTVAATAGDSVKLPLSVLGAQITVFNRGLVAINVFTFSNSGDAINGAATSAAFSIPAGKGCIFTCCSVNNWDVILSA